MPEAAALSASIGHLFRKEEEVMPNVTQLRQDHANMARRTATRRSSVVSVPTFA